MLKIRIALPHLIIVVFLLLLVGCSGGSNDGEDSNSGVSNSANNDAGNPLTQDNEIPPITDVPNQGIANGTVLSSAAGYDIDIVWAEGMPISSTSVPENSTLESLRGYVINSDGKIAMIGTILSPRVTEQNPNPGSAQQLTTIVLAGEPQSPELVIQAGDSFVDLLPGIQYTGGEDLSITQQGRVGFVATISGSVDGSGYALQTDNGLELIAYTDGTTLTDHLGDRYAVTRVSGGVAAGSSALIGGSVRPVGNNDWQVQALWLWKDSESTIIAKESLFDDGPIPVTDDGCSVQYTRYEEKNFALRENGDVYFLTDYGYQNPASCGFGPALVRYRDGQYTSIMRNRRPLPGFPGDTINHIDVLKFDNEHGILFTTSLEKNNGSDFPVQFFALWFYDFETEVFDLMAVDGQQIEYPIGEAFVNLAWNDNRQIDIHAESREWITQFDAGVSGFTILGGSFDNIQGINSLQNPGSLSLPTLLTAVSSVDGFDENSSHAYATNLDALGDGKFLMTSAVSTIGEPGNRMFVKWIHQDGALSELFRTGDTIQGPKSNYVIESAGIRSFDVNNVYTPNVTSNGIVFTDLTLLEAEREQRFASGLITLTPQVQ